MELKNPDYPIVRIKWRDAMTIKDNWHELKKDIQEPGYCVSVGFLVASNDKIKTLYSHIALEDDWSNECGKGNMIIPNDVIESLEYLTAQQ